MARWALAAACATMLLASRAGAYVLHGFDTGDYPNSPVAVAPDRSVYGTTLEGGTGYGTVYRLAPAGSGMPWTYQTIYSFAGGTDGDRPGGRLVLGADGTVYGVTTSGGLASGRECAIGCGTVFSLTPPAQGQTAWTKTTLTAFEGGPPSSGLLMGQGGTLFGTLGARPGSGGMVYQLIPPASGQGGWSYGVIFRFHLTSVRGTNPIGELTTNHVGDVIGTTSQGGTILTGNEYCGQGCGTVYSLHPPQDGASVWRFRQVYALQPANGYNPQLGVTGDGHGALYMLVTSEVDAATNLLKLENPANGGLWTASNVHAFPTGKNDGIDADGLAQSGGDVYGITLGGGSMNQQVGPCGTGYDGCGTLFEIVPSGVAILLTETAAGGTSPRYLSASGDHVYLTNSAKGPGASAGTILRLKPGG